MAGIVALIVILVIVAIVMTGRSLKVVQQYEEGILFRFGRVLPGVRGPGLHAIRPIGDRMQKVNMQIVALAVPAQEGITRDNVSVRVDAVVYFRVVDAIKATINVQDYQYAILQQAQTSLRSIIGQSEMDQLLAERDSVNRELRRIIDEPTEGPWGIRVERVEIKDVSLPEGMKRSMSRQAEAERERRARIITADGEFQASKRLAAAANVMSRDPAALQLRLLQTVVEVAAERNSTLVMPIPVELLRFFDKFTPTSGNAGLENLEEEGDKEVAQVEASAGNASDVPLQIPEVPEIPELTAAQKGERAEPGEHPIAEPEPAEAAQNGAGTAGSAAAPLPDATTDIEGKG
jgi:regulator of protease activity HflC (stomatin/prohibitin superfamily)